MRIRCFVTEMMPSPIDVLRARRAGADDEYRVALVVEGGCMRGVIYAGAVTALEHLHLAQRFDAVYGVSAGALDSAYMLAGQAAMGTTIYFEDLPAVHFMRARRVLAAGRRSPSTRSSMGSSRGESASTSRPSRTPGPSSMCSRPASSTVHLNVPTARCSSDRALRRGCRCSAARRCASTVRLYDGGLLSPLPVELAAADGATHILVLRTRPDGSAVRRHAHVERAMLSWLRRAHPETRWMPVVPGGRYERELAALPAGITAHGNAQVQVIVLHAPPMSQSETNPSALRAGAWTGLTSVERVAGERVDRGVLDAHAWR